MLCRTQCPWYHQQSHSINISNIFIHCIIIYDNSSSLMIINDYGSWFLVTSLADNETETRKPAKTSGCSIQPCFLAKTEENNFRISLLIKKAKKTLCSMEVVLLWKHHLKFNHLKYYLFLCNASTNVENSDGKSCGFKSRPIIFAKVCLTKQIEWEIWKLGLGAQWPLYLNI